MFGRRIGGLALLFLTASASGSAALSPAIPTGADWAEACTDWDEWDKPGPPFRIHGNTYYVGTCGISAILVTSEEGHALIDSGTEAGANIVAANIQRLGFTLTDVKVLLMSHEHFDHVGGMARLRELTGARIVSSEAAAKVLSSGEVDPDDPQFGIVEDFPAARVDRTIGNGGAVNIGPLKFTAIATPGHTPGALSWTWIEWHHYDPDEAGFGESVGFPVVYADSLSPINADGYRFSDRAEYVRDYREGLARLAEYDSCLVLTPHPSASQMRERILSVDGLVSAPATCAEYAANIEARLDARLAEEAATPDG